jgi:hypothetical protein
VQTGTCATNRDNWCEIGDFSCDGTTSTLDGVTVQPYWSVKDNACTVPTQRDRCCSQRAVVDDLEEQIQILQTDLQDIWEIPANIRERVRALYLKELHNLERELDSARGDLQQCEAGG